MPAKFEASEFNSAALKFPSADRVNATPDPTVVGSAANMNKPLPVRGSTHPDDTSSGTATAANATGKTNTMTA